MASCTSRSRGGLNLMISASRSKKTCSSVRGSGPGSSSGSGSGVGSGSFEDLQLRLGRRGVAEEVVEHEGQEAR
eukprot:scaffold62709_cov18-Phaeocystis_antarctica.AAC.1